MQNITQFIQSISQYPIVQIAEKVAAAAIVGGVVTTIALSIFDDFYTDGANLQGKKDQIFQYSACVCGGLKFAQIAADFRYIKSIAEPLKNWTWKVIQYTLN